jgi:hypothetical protein
MMRASIDAKRFGPWALITGASSGIGREFARQLAAAGLNTALVARRRVLLEEVGRGLAKDFGVEYRVITADLSTEGFIEELAEATQDLDIGLVVSNAGTGNPGKFLKLSRDELVNILRLNTLAHLDIAHHFGRRLATRGRGGIVLLGALGAIQGIPYMANDSATKAYVQSLGEALHVELEPLGVSVTVLAPGPTETPVLAKLGIGADSLPVKPMPVEQCVSEGLKALQENRSTQIPGRLNRIMNAVIPASLMRKMMGKMIAKTQASEADR